MDQQVGRKQLVASQDGPSWDDGGTGVKKRLRPLGRDGLRHGGQVEAGPQDRWAQPIDEERGEELASMKRRGFGASRVPQDLAEIPAPRAGRSHDKVKIDASGISFLAQMRDFLQRNSTWFLVAALVLLVLQDVFGTHGVLAMRRSQKEAAAVQKEIQELHDENQKLQNRVQSLKSDPATIERIAREEMGLARPGEYIFKLQPKPGEPSTPLAQPAEPPKRR